MSAQAVAILVTDSWGSPLSFCYTGAVFRLGAGKRYLYPAAAPTITPEMWQAGLTEYAAWARETYIKGMPDDAERAKGVARATRAMTAAWKAPDEPA